MCEITVLMTVKNGENYIKETIDSVLEQSFNNFEFIIIDNYSTDNTGTFIKSYTDPRIRLLDQAANSIKALNKGLSMAKGKFFVRINIGDIMHSERLRIMYKRMALNPDISVCVTWLKYFNDNGFILPFSQLGKGYIDNLMLGMLQSNVAVQPSAMIRKSFLDDHKLRYQNLPLMEEFKLWVEIAKAGGNFYIEPQYLLNYRISAIQMTAKKEEIIRAQMRIIKKDIIYFLLKELDEERALLKLYTTMIDLERKKHILPEETFQLFGNMLTRKIRGKHRK